MGKFKETAWLLLLQEKHLGEKKWWLNLNQDKQKRESLDEETGAFAAPFTKDIYRTSMKQCEDSFTKQQQ